MTPNVQSKNGLQKILRVWEWKLMLKLKPRNCISVLNIQISYLIYIWLAKVHKTITLSLLHKILTLLLRLLIIYYIIHYAWLFLLHNLYVPVIIAVLSSPVHCNSLCTISIICVQIMYSAFFVIT
jgi:hypothetical protein